MQTKWWVPAAFLSVPLVVFSMWVIIPILVTARLAFTDWDGMSRVIQFVGLSNFRTLFGSRRFWTALLNNLRWLIGFTMIGVPVGLGLAMFFDQPLPGMKIGKTLVFIPITLSFVVIGNMWSWILQPRGALNLFLRLIGLHALARSWLSDPSLVTWSLIAAASWQQVILCMVFFIAGLKTVPQDLVDAALVDGAGPLQRFRHVVFPMLLPATIVAFSYSIILSLRAFDIVYTVTRGGPHGSSNVMANYMYIESFTSFRMGYGSAIAVVQFSITLLFISVYLAHVFRQEVGR